MNSIEFIIKSLSPYFRIVIFFTFTTLGLTAASTFGNVLEEKHYTDGGLKKISTEGYELIHIVNIVIALFQFLTCFYVGMKMVHVPHQPYKKDVSFIDKYIFDTHESVFLLIAAGINSNLLAENLLNNNLFQSIYKDSTDDAIMTDERFHITIKYFFIVVRFFLLTLGLCYITFNLVVKGNNRLLRDRPKGIEWAIHIIPSFLFASHIYYGIVHFVELHPQSLEKFYFDELPEVVRNRHLEFVLENVGDLFLSVVGFALVWIYDIGTRNHLASTILFNTIIMGCYGTCIAAKNAYSVHVLHGDDNLYYAPFILYAATIVGVIIINSIKYNSIKQSIIDYLKTFYIAMGGNIAPKELLWKIGITMVIAGMFLAGISTQAQWFTFDIKPGSLPNETYHVLDTTVDHLEGMGNKVFSTIKDLDPCRWGHSDHQPAATVKEEVSYNYDPFETPSGIDRTEFSIKNYDISEMNCECNDHVTNKEACPCKYINKIKDKNVTSSRSKQQDIFTSSEIGKVHNDYNNFADMVDTSNYVDSMKECHSVECDVVLGVAIAAEVSLYAGDALSWIPFLGGAIDTAAWFAEVGNRVGHNIVKYAIKAGRWLSGLAKKITYFEPLIFLLKDLSELKFKVSYHFNMDILLVYAPLILSGFSGILIGFWRRENVHKAFQSFSIVVSFFVPLMILNFTMVGLMYLFPLIVDGICKEIPSFVMVVTPTEHIGFTLLRSAYLVTSLGTFILVISSLLDDAYIMRKKAFSLRQFFKHPFKRNSQVSSTGFDIKDHIDSGWWQAFIISLPVFIIFAYAYRNDIKFLNYQYGPSGPLLKAVNAFHGHPNMLKESTHIDDWVNENSLCGIVGKAIDSIIGTIVSEVKDITTTVLESLETFADSIIHFSSIITNFEDEGKKIINVIDNAWGVAEKTLVLIVPVLSSIIFFAVASTLPRTDPDHKEEAVRTVEQLLLIGIYYNVALMVMMHQLFSTISNMNLHVFYFEFKAGPLMPLGFIATGLNALSLFALYVEKIYKTE